MPSLQGEYLWDFMCWLEDWYSLIDSLRYPDGLARLMNKELNIEMVVHTQSIYTEIPKYDSCSRWSFLKTPASFTYAFEHTVYCVGMCVRMYATCECSILYISSTWVNKLLYKMLLFLLNIIVMNHNVTFLYFDDCIFNILLELYFTL